MSEYRGFDIVDYFIIISKWKKFLLSLAAFTLVLSYFAIYFLIHEKYDSRSLVVVSDSDQTGGIASLMKSFSNLPISIPGLKSGTNTDIFTTIVFSRTNLENVIKKFDLISEYRSENLEEAVKELSQNIVADETKEGAYEIIVSDRSPKKAAEMVNYLVGLLNNTLIDLNVSKSKDNRIFLESRYDELKTKLRKAEDSLVYYQNKSGILSAQDQAKASFEAYSSLEGQLVSKQVEYSILAKLYGEDSPLTKAAKISVTEFADKLNEIKSGKEGSNLILALKNLPQNTMKYLRLYRDVEIYNKMLEFIIPLYEQARYEEQKDVPVLKIIDKGVPAYKKSFPPRALLTLVFTMIVFLIALFVIFIREWLNNPGNLKMQALKQSFTSWK